MSEAGSMIASPVQLTQEEAEAEEVDEDDSSLAGQLAAAIKKRKTKKAKRDSVEEKDSRSSFRKRWSLRRKSRDKNKGSPSVSRPQEESPPQRQQALPGGEDQNVDGREEAEMASTDEDRLLANSDKGGIQGELMKSIQSN